MLFEPIATSVDSIYLTTVVRRTLPYLSMNRSLRQLAIAETRAKANIPDAALFCTATSDAKTSEVSNSRGLSELRVTQELAAIPIAATWGHSSNIGELESIWRLRGATPRPLLILVGGWNRSRHVTPARVWPLASLDREGFDVAIPCLPWESRTGAGTRSFPSNDPCMNIVTASTFVNGLVQLVARARAQGHPSITVFATSLGAYLAALVATLPGAAGVDRFVFEKPLGRLSDLIRWHARGEPTWCHHVADRLQRVYRSVDPLEREPTAAPERVTVIGAKFDQVTPLHAAQSVADHFHVPLRPIEASHLFDPGRSRRLVRLAHEGARSQRGE
jgi:pimeloyl-ACP methyl ester carboxylesterase